MLTAFDLIGVAAVSFLASYLGSYTRRKGENLATKEDISEITRKQELVRDEFQQLREQSTQKHQLRLAAIDRRLETHQQAYALWWKLVTNSNKKEQSVVPVECQEWFYKNCLYLDGDAGKAFERAYMAASTRPLFWDAMPRDTKGMKENWELILRAGEVIAAAVELPGLRITEEESKKFEGVSPSSHNS